jgi:hypothetical protein
LSLQLVAGNDFMAKNMVKNSDIQWNKIKELCSKTPAFYELNKGVSNSNSAI